ncbi:MAG: extracellular solute-binding protein [Clostridia bacterium]|nr:extracellular solute-binding protein [Clostridia bacterium]
MKRFFALALVLALAFSVPALATSLTPEGWFPLTEEPLTLTFAAKQGGNQIDYGDMIVWQKYEELTNVHIDWIMIPSANFTERENVMFASGDLPDGIYKAGLNMANLTKFATEGQILSMSPYLSECPNLTAFYERHPDVVASVSIDGEIYGVGYYNEHPALAVGARLFINQEWLKNVGKEMPTTIDEYTELLRTFKAEDANGNGDPNDEIPLCLADDAVGTLITTFCGSWGLANHGVKETYIDLDPETEAIRFYPAAEEYRDFLRWLNMLYTEELLDQQCFTIAYEEFVANGTSGLVGSFPYVNTTLMGEKHTQYAGLNEALEGPNGDKMFACSQSVVYTPGAFVMCDGNKDPLVTMKWLDYFYGTDGAELLFMTEKGLLYDTDENGRNYYVDYVANNPDGLTMSQVIGQYSSWSGGGNPALLIDNYFIGGETLPIPFAAAMNLIDWLPKTVWEAFSYTTEETEDKTVLFNDIDSYVKEMRAAFIKGTASLDTDWDTYLGELNKMRLPDYLKIVGDAYARYLEN